MTKIISILLVFAIALTSLAACDSSLSVEPDVPAVDDTAADTPSVTAPAEPTSELTNTEDVPLPEPEAVAERPEKLSPELRDWVASASEGDIKKVWIFRDSISDDLIDALVQQEYGFEPEVQDDGDLVIEGPAEDRTPAENEQMQEEHEYINALIEARRTVLKREYTKLNDEFIANYVPKERKVIYAGVFDSTIIVEATAGEILKYSALREVTDISVYFEAEQSTESSGEEDIIEASDPTITD